MVQLLSDALESIATHRVKQLQWLSQLLPLMGSPSLSLFLCLTFSSRVCIAFFFLAAATAVEASARCVSTRKSLSSSI